MSNHNLWGRLYRLMCLLWTLGPREMALVGGVYVVSGLMPICSVMAIQEMVNHAVALVQGNGDLQAALLWLVGLIGANYLMWASSPVREWIGYGILERFKARAQERLLKKASRVSLGTFETPAFYDQLHRAHRGVDERLLGTMMNFFPIPAHLVTAVGMLIFLGSTHWALPLVLVVGLIPGYILERRIDRKRYRLDLKHTGPQRRLDYLGDLMIQREMAAEIRLFGLEAYLLDRWRRLYLSLRDDRLRLAFERIKGTVAGVVGNQLAFGFVLTGIVALIARGSLSVGFYAACVEGVEFFRDSVQALFNGVRGMEDDLQYLGDLLAYLELEDEAGSRRVTKPTCPSTSHTKGHETPPVHRSGDVRHVPEVYFERVTFAYPGSEVLVLDGVDLRICAGERIALVGENGAGKTTLAKLLLGLYRPRGGRIWVDGRDLDDLDLFGWRERVGAVFQDYVRYQITTRENIGFGNLSRVEDEEAIGMAARKSGADELVSGLSSGYETVLGRVHDPSGQDLSVGQWQKLAIARAYLRDAQILVLDEPTAALDARAEVEVYRQFRDMSVGKSVLLISHRLGSARLADRIVFLEGGRIVEDGSHDDLMRQGGRYAEMFQIQAGWYT